MVKIINKNILTIDRGIICHQVNCQRAMGAGIALAIRNKWPHVYQQYSKVNPKLGLVQVLDAVHAANGEPIKVANLFAQNLSVIPGTDRCTDYDALADCLTKINSYTELLNSGRKGYGKQGLTMPLYIPYMIGCGLGGGDWEKVLDMIIELTPKATICRYTP